MICIQDAEHCGPQTDDHATLAGVSLSTRQPSAACAWLSTRYKSLLLVHSGKQTASLQGDTTLTLSLQPQHAWPASSKHHCLQSSTLGPVIPTSAHDGEPVRPYILGFLRPGECRHCKVRRQGGSQHSSCAALRQPRRWWACYGICAALHKPPAAGEPTVSWELSDPAQLLARL